MGYYKEVNVKITGQVDDDDNEYDTIVAEINLICAKYGLKYEECDDDNEW